MRAEALRGKPEATADRSGGLKTEGRGLRTED